MISHLRLIRRCAVFSLIALAVAALVGAPVRVTASNAGAGQAAPAGQDSVNRAGLVVRYEDGDVETVCVSFTEPVIYGDEMLQLAGIDAGIATDGRVCSIDGVGCGINDCWCQCQDLNSCTYWAYYHLAGGAWQYSNLGPTLSQVQDGAVEGWSWGQGTVVSGVEPPIFTFDQICNAAAQATATFTPTTTPTATATVAQQSAATTPPQVNLFQASPTNLAAGACATLEWSVVNADEVRVDGAVVGLQGQQQVCPTASRSYSLLAVNAAGSIAREVSVLVAGATVMQATSSPTLAANPPVITPTPRAPLAGGGANPVPRATAIVIPTVPAAPGLPAASGSAPDSAAAPVLLSPPTPAATPTPIRLTLPPSATPRPRRVLGADGRPTPTPMLLARAADAAPLQPQAQPAERARTARGRATPDRSFQASLLPGYAAFLLTTACMAVMGVWIMRRKHAPRPPAPTRRDTVSRRQ